ncbi:PGF-CTERM sorting domain-containing protein [Halorussus sp. JP-T4]|nr:PGF-CTERM sorting domain-containing protein [Halorussus sp. JP-T4]
MATPLVAASNGTNASGTAQNATDAGAAQNATPNPCAGTITAPANGTTVISVQGFRFGEQGGKRPAKLVGVGPRGQVEWVHQNGERYDVVWGYDVDPMDNGNLFITATVKGHQTLVYEFDPETQERVWSKTFDEADTHDADLINNGTEILVANMRNYNESADRNDDRLFVYNRTTDEITWEWRFADHYDPGNLEENYTDDWTHVNDVDKIGEGLYLASPRNFDQAVVVNRSTNEIVMKLGEDGKTDILNEQHNPDYLESENGTPTLLVGDSENDRIVEYANPDGDLTDGTGWNRTWTLTGDLAWPRDADRLPSGNTLVSDSSNHRVLEVTPEGEVVWEFYAPWLVYDAARLPAGEHGGPTMTDLNATGTHEVHGDADIHQNATRLEACHELLANVSGLADGGATAGETTDGASAGETTERAMEDGTTESDAGETDDEQAEPAGAHTEVPGFGPLEGVAGLLGSLALLFVGIGVSRRR